MLAPAATFISQGTAHAVLNGGGEDSIFNDGAQNGFDSDLLFAGDQVNLFNEQNFHSAEDISNDDGGNFHLCDIADVFC
jgi:hypothetical protein